MPLIRKLAILGAAIGAMALPGASAFAAVVSEVEPNNGFSTAQNLNDYFDVSPNSDVLFAQVFSHVTVNGTGDDTLDYYSFDVGASGQLVFGDIDHSVNLDSHLRLFDSNHTLIQFNDDIPFVDAGSASFFDSLLFAVVEAGTYYLEVDRYLGGGVGVGASYTLHISNTSPVPIPAAAWLFGSALIGMVAVARRRRERKTSGEGIVAA